MKRLTVFTPTYNRSYILQKLYDSLCNQKSEEFIWLIVDDGSTDDTKELINNWMCEKKIPIKYIYQENGGKMRAHNTGVKNTETELFVCVDSDDYLTDDGIYNILHFWDKIDIKSSYSGIVAYKGKNNKEPVGNKFPEGIEKSALCDLYRQGFSGDTTLVFKTSILKKYLFPEIEGEKFITEAYIYDQIDEKYNLAVLNKIIIVCQYLDDGYTNNTLPLLKNNLKGWTLFYNQKVRLSKNVKEKFYYMAQYICCGKLSGNKKIFINTNSKMLYILAYFPALYLIYKRKKQFKSVNRND